MINSNELQVRMKIFIDKSKVVKNKLDYLTTSLARSEEKMKNIDNQLTNLKEDLKMLAIARFQSMNLRLLCSHKKSKD